jgi:putative flippase GtrA
MNSNATQSTAAASGISAGAVASVVIWVLSLYHIDIPADVAVNAVGLIGAAIHFVVIWVITQKNPVPNITVAAEPIPGAADSARK